MEETDAKSKKLPAPEAARRVRAARELAGFRSGQAFRDAARDEKGFPPDRLKHIEGGKKELEPYVVEFIANFIGLPEQWFTDPLAEVIPWEKPKPGQLDRIEAALEKIETKLDAADPTQELGDSDQETG